jgi:7-carboxy-7-deazaguanine synthase
MDGAMPDTILISELFGPVLQGEGALAGKVSHFVRSAGCSFRCSWCDSLHAVLPIRIKESSRRLTVDQIVNEVQKLPPAPWVTLSGGDPVAWDDLGSVAANLKLLKYKVAVETQGAMWNDWLHYADLVTCSPKGPSSGMVDKLDVAVLQKYKARLGSKLVFKIVAFDEVDLDFAERIHRAFSDVPLYITSGTPQQSKSRFATQMNTIDAYREISEAVLKRPALLDATVGCQQHVILYGNELGR